MTLNEITQNSNYVTDEDLVSSNLLGIANTAIGEVNAFCGTMLPFFTDASLTDPEAYFALPDTWQSRLIEPYYAYSIAANDGDINARDFHYERFKQALAQFKYNGGMGSISDNEFIGENNNDHVKMDVSDITVHWMDWI